MNEPIMVVKGWGWGEGSKQVQGNLLKNLPALSLARKGWKDTPGLIKKASS